ncbi:MAG: anion permease, partial [Marinobacter sp.]|nr:anion permease [Marinobacter sp.]
MTEEPNADRQTEGLPRSQIIGLALGTAFLLATILLPPPETMAAEAWSALGLMLLMATWWSTEAIPIPATALLPIVLVPALGLGSVGEAT